jgi:hypothetical protein
MYDAARALRDAGIPMIGGFHSPMEKECLSMLHKGTQPLVIRPARSIQNMRIPSAWRRPIEKGRLLILSVFPSEAKRMTTELSERRNRLVAAVPTALLVGWLSLGGSVEKLAYEYLDQGKRAFSLSIPEWSSLHGIGLRTWKLEDVATAILHGATSAQLR